MLQWPNRELPIILEQPNQELSKMLGADLDKISVSFTLLLRMSIPDYNLTKDEETLHHYAATLKKILEAYHACESRDENAWVNEFKVFLVRSMVYFTDAISRSGTRPCVHPLFLSLTEVISQIGNSPDISTVSENDPRALRSNYYTAPSDLPPLDIHFNGQNVCNLQNALSQHEELLAEATDATFDIPRNGKKHHSAPSDKCKVVTRSAAKRKVVEQVETTAASASKGKAGDDENMILPELAVKRHPGYKTNAEERWQRRQVSEREQGRKPKQMGNKLRR
ncbi:hypothetical protein EI94DRAFT_1697623 [Lactarius quietus]|nr:hypothetical protein EI94DRAFT_1697623 [Lactarius quietus]